eukprot:TRINITY_DN18983_c0_g1_i1.p1 TRINITY_DN18983_c0_g1~~TRINITY_DN18983_c0_g1_i1.p1  ORF type:complete len:1191 (+),score=302.06 TRINITY_DN18983_c0_g1_i1:168-3740(+)
MPPNLADLLPTEADLLYEEEILRNPFSLKLWWRYLQARRDGPVKARKILFERALIALPGSYKLWNAYLQERQAGVRGLSIRNPACAALSNTYERALVTMHKMPRIWLNYLDHLIEQKEVTKARRTFDRALRSLPATQHDRIWELYLKFVQRDEVPIETALSVYRRFLKFEPLQVETYIDFLLAAERWQEAADRLAQVLNDPEFSSVKGKSKHKLWLELCDLLTKHATDITGVKVDPIIRGGLRKFSDQVGRLWTSLADFYVRRGLFENARDIYEEGMESVRTVVDFTMIFDAYTQFDESMIAAKLAMKGKKEESQRALERKRVIAMVKAMRTVELKQRAKEKEAARERARIKAEEEKKRQIEARKATSGNAGTVVGGKSSNAKGKQGAKEKGKGKEGGLGLVLAAIQAQKGVVAAESAVVETAAEEEAAAAAAGAEPAAASAVEGAEPSKMAAEVDQKAAVQSTDGSDGKDTEQRQDADGQAAAGDALPSKRQPGGTLEEGTATEMEGVEGASAKGGDEREDGTTGATAPRDGGNDEGHEKASDNEEARYSINERGTEGEEGEEGEVDDEDEGIDNDEDDDNWLNEDDDLDLRMARFEHLLERQPILVSSVKLRQNPHDVYEWHKRVKLFTDPAQKIQTYVEAIKTVDVQKAVGKPNTLWIKYAGMYEEYGDLANARVVYEKGVQADFKSVDDLAHLWCMWAEMELRAKNFKGARELMKRAVAEPSVATLRQAEAEGQSERVQYRLFKSLKLWTFYVDLEESLGTLESTRVLYDRVMDLKIATPQIIVNYATLLEESKYFEDAFKIYERGVHIFKYPHVKDIWNGYLTKFVKHYGGRKLERARDLFEEALEKAPADECRALYLQYAKLEEEFGLARHAMALYERATKAVPDAEKMGVYEIYIARAAEFYGVPKTREIYERAIESGLPEADVKTMCLKYAALERSLSEIDRARAIYIHAAQLADPRSDHLFWETWNNFEINHGNEDTFREMLRIKRSVSASYSQMHFILPEYLMQKAAQPSPVPPPPPHGAPGGGPRDLPQFGGNIANDPMGGLEAQVEGATAATGISRGTEVLPGPPPSRFVSSGHEQLPSGVYRNGATMVPATNPEEIELKDDGDEDEEEEKEGGEVPVVLAQVQVPDGVFGEQLKEKAREMLEKEKEGEGGRGERREREKESEPLGALERFKRQKTKD